jgi:hypothetical protein
MRASAGACFRDGEGQSKRACLPDIPLVTGERLVFDGDAKTFSLE